MPFPIVAAALGAQALGSALGAWGQSRSQSKAQKEDRRQFDLQHGLDREKFGYQREADQATRRRQAALDPAKQQMLAALMQRLGLAAPGGAAGAQPTPGFNPQAAQQAAPTPAMLAPQMAPPPAGDVSQAMQQDPRIAALVRRFGMFG